jgi:ankyrin repeat protein
LHLASYTGNP